MDETQIDKLFAYLDRLVTGIELLVKRDSISAKRAAAGRMGAAAVRRADDGTFQPAKALPPAKPARTQQVATLPTKSPIPFLIGTYVESWQRRYKTRARPEVTKALGVFKGLLQERKAEDIAILLQVYCQMDDRWFVTKHHDIVTFGANVGKIAVAGDKGHERPDGEKHWQEIAEEREGK